MDNKSNPCWIVGVLDSGLDALTPAARRLLEAAELVLGDDRFLALFAPLLASHAECRSFSGQLKLLPGWIASALEQGKRVVVLATGDPLFSGVAGHLHHKLPLGSCRVLPAPSTPQLAFARLGLPWTDARFVSVHAGDGGEWTDAAGSDHPLYPLYRALQTARKLAILTSPANTPGRIARMLLQLGWGERCQMTVAACLETPQEQLYPALGLAEAAQADFACPNVVILHCQQAARAALTEVVLGLADDLFLPAGAKSALMTKREVRVLALANLALRPDSIVWDIGAGSGSVGLEAARLVPQGWVYAVEKDPDRSRQIQQTKLRLAIANYQLLTGRAPAGLERWPDPDAIFIGGSDGSLPALLTLAAQRLRPAGRLVITLVTLENLSTLLAALQTLGWLWHLTQLQVSHAQPILDMHRLVPANPVWMVTAYLST
ncbi:MAG: precorrin-6y C5,15-methyltransferase (decarboxylating) subunit CbiE [Magnetococcales bacterium]|nr:precorrin-6y C5,15-methyltransferase (decarboxylating) subunit CbiE [Magnetococcales bacterium]